MELKSFAKVNLFLKVLNKRPDNYHNIETIFEKISLFDSLSLKLRKDGLIVISCNKKEVPKGAQNLCYKAASMLQEATGCKKGVDIRITKRIPLGAGLGGGSSNAAAVLNGLNRLWKLRLPRRKLVNLASRIGSDVAFFIYKAPFALGESRGEKITILSNLNKINLWHILIVPDLRVSTPLIYGKFGNFSRLTSPSCNAKILTSELIKKAFLQKEVSLYNSLERVTFRLYPEVERAKKTLLGMGLKNVLMSGSGCAVFALALSRKEALKTASKIREKERKWFISVVNTA